MKVLTKAHFHHLLHFIENVLRSTLSYVNETSKELIHFLSGSVISWITQYLASLHEKQVFFHSPKIVMAQRKSNKKQVKQGILLFITVVCKLFLGNTTITKMSNCIK